MVPALPENTGFAVLILFRNVPGVQLYETAPVVVKVIFCVLQMMVSGIVFTTGNGFTVIVMVSLAAQPPVAVPVTISVLVTVSVKFGLEMVESLTYKPGLQ